MKIFFDTEFTGLHKNTELISIGLIAENGYTFYGEITNYDKSQVDNWIQENVINNLKHNGNHIIEETKESYEISMNFEDVSFALNKWLKQFDTVEWVSDVCHYDMVLLIDLLTNHGSALDLPYGKINSACHDINQDIAEAYHISEILAFDKSREEILKDSKIEITGEKHNSLYDAKVIKAIYDCLYGYIKYGKFLNNKPIR